jgi:hypothetical protein
MTKLIREEVINILIRRDGDHCQFPGCNLPFTEENPATIDHWKPRSIFMDDSIENLKLMHFDCNNRKGNIIPNEDGTIDVKSKSKTPKLKKPEVCQSCMSGRMLIEGEVCTHCGSGPQPYGTPRYKQRKPKNCDHDNYHCWACHIGVIPRKSVIENLIMGD